MPEGQNTDDPWRGRGRWEEPTRGSRAFGLSHHISPKLPGFLHFVIIHVPVHLRYTHFMNSHYISIIVSRKIKEKPTSSVHTPRVAKL